MTARYEINIRPRARRALRDLDPAARRAVARMIDDLADDPRPPGVRPLKGHRPYLRVRSGDYRVIYTVNDQDGVVTIATMGHRSKVYRGLDL